MKFGFALFFERNAVVKESGTCQPERAPLKGNFGRTGALKAISIIRCEHPAQERGKQAWENQQQITTLRYDLKMWGEKYKFSQREFYSQRQSGTSVPGSGLSNTYRTSVPGSGLSNTYRTSITGDGLSNSYRTSVLGVAQYRVQISGPGTARVTVFFLFGINQ
jgi:hypothetical protein